MEESRWSRDFFRARRLPPPAQPRRPVGRFALGEAGRCLFPAGMSAAPRNPPEPPEGETPRREFRLKPTEFERANRPADAFGDNAASDTRQIYREANARSPSAAAPAPAENEVQAILRDNVARAQAAGLDEVIPQRRRPSRRKRDYWLMLGVGNLLVVGAVLGLHQNAVTLVFGLSAVVLFTLGLTWVMWAVMDDY